MEALKKWAEHVNKDGIRESSRIRMVGVIEHFIRTIGEKDVYTGEDVKIFIAGLRERGRTENYVRTYWDYLKAWFVLMEWPWPFKKGEAPTRSDPIQEALTPDETRLLFERTERFPTMHLAIRIAAMLGIRRAELCMLRRSMYRRPEIHVYALKHGRGGWKTLDPETCDEIERYMRMRPTTGDELLVDDDGAPIMEWWLDRHMHEILKDVGIYRRQLGWHGIRRGVATWLHDRGMSETEITRRSTWKTPTMVHRYIQTKREVIEKKALELHPLLKKKE